MSSVAKRDPRCKSAVIARHRATGSRRDAEYERYWRNLFIQKRWNETGRGERASDCPLTNKRSIGILPYVRAHVCVYKYTRETALVSIDDGSIRGTSAPRKVEDRQLTLPKHPTIHAVHRFFTKNCASRRDGNASNSSSKL